MTVRASVTATIPTGAMATATLYEDTDGDGTAENTETLVLKDGTNDYQFPSAVGDTANDYWLEFDLITEDNSVTPDIDTVTVDPNPGTGDSDLTATATLNGQLARATIYEDTDGDGTAENQITTALPDGTNTFTVFNLSGDNTNDHWVDVDILTFDTSQTATVDELSLTLTAGNVDTGSLTTATGTALSPEVTRTVTEAAGTLGTTATALTAAGTSEITASSTVTAATATVLSASEAVEDVISGTVSLSGSGVQGARVFVIDTDTDTIEATATTDTYGDYSVTVPAEAPYHVAVQYDDGSQKYNALSKPYIN
jgi:hypothetical protein